MSGPTFDPAPTSRAEVEDIDPVPEEVGFALRPLDRAEVAAYVGDITAELARMSRDVELDTLAYLLDIVRLEATTFTRRSRTEPA